MSKNAEVIIIGSGVIGCAAAYYLAKQGVSVIVLEKTDNIGNGASSRNGGGVRQSGRDPRELPLAMYGIQHIWPSLSEELGVDVESHKEGNLRLVGSSLRRWYRHLDTPCRILYSERKEGCEEISITNEI